MEGRILPMYMYFKLGMYSSVLATEERSRAVWRVNVVPHSKDIPGWSMGDTDASNHVAYTSADECKNPEELWP